MSPDDQRHGTVAGYNRIPCRESCCRDAMARYRRGREWDVMSGRPRVINATGTRRRLEALMWLGWSRATIGSRAGIGATNMTRLRNAPTVTSATAARIARVFDELSMTLPPNTQAAANVRNLARRRGYLPPLAWDDIDDPAERPACTTGHRRKDDIDDVVVERVLAGERLSTSLAEKHEITRRWTARGRSLNELERVTGWKSDRYTDREEAS